MSDHFAVSSLSWVYRTSSGDKTLLCGRSLIRSFAFDPSTPFKTVDGGAKRTRRFLSVLRKFAGCEAECCIHAKARGTRNFQMSISNVPCGKSTRFVMRFSHLGESREREVRGSSSCQQRLTILLRSSDNSRLLAHLCW